MTTWHITWGTYGARLHGGDRPTVDRHATSRAQPFVERNERRERFEQSIMRGAPVLLTHEQQLFIEERIPALCDRGGWRLRTCAAASEGDHVHVLLDADPSVHGEKIRRLLKRWLTQELNGSYDRPDGGRWWAMEGSNRAVADNAYLNNVVPYIDRQRTTAAASVAADQ